MLICFLLSGMPIVCVQMLSIKEAFVRNVSTYIQNLSPNPPTQKKAAFVIGYFFNLEVLEHFKEIHFPYQKLSNLFNLTRIMIILCCRFSKHGLLQLKSYLINYYSTFIISDGTFRNVETFP